MGEGKPWLADLPACTRLILRGRAAAIAAATVPLGFALPQRPCRAATLGARSALWLGPDEWLILALAGDPVGAAMEQALRGFPHAVVDVSHRQCAIEVSGPGAADLLNAGCPLDLDDAAFPVGMCTRSVLGRSEIVLWRSGAAVFRLEVARSFADYVRRFLAEAARD